jgi:hypothetical protein
MSDPMFRSFRQPLEVSPPDPRELRLRGERRARRTTIATLAGAVLLVVAVVAPVAALSNGDDKSAPPVLPSPSPTRPANVAWVRTIPDGFPLGEGIPMPGEASAQMQRGEGQPLLPCGNGQSSLGQSQGWTDVATASNSRVVDPVDGIDTRLLALYASDQEARQVPVNIAQMYDACTPGAPGVGPEVVRRVGDQNAWTLTYPTSSKPVGQLITIEQVGNAVLVQRDTLNAADDRTVQQRLAEVRAGQRNVVAAMCVFAAEPCAPPTSPGSAEDPTVAHVDEIPDSFPLDAAYEDPGSDGEVHTPSPDGEGVVFDPCGVEAFAMPSQDRLAFQVTGPEYADTRELRTYPSADEAVAQLDRLRSAVADCPRDDSAGPADAMVWRVVDVDTGYDSVAVTQTYEQGLGGGAWVFTRVGRSILALVEGGEFSAETARVRVPAMVDRAKQITPSMCTFTDAGC